MDEIAFNFGLGDLSGIGVVTETTAGFASQCPACGDPILEGDRIKCIEDDWVHARCPAEDIAAMMVCPRCRLVHAGECL